MIATAFRSLARDNWVLGIAAAAALTYATVRLIEETITVALLLFEGPRVVEDDAVADDFFDPPFTFVFRGRYIFYADLAQAAVLFVIVVIVAAAIVHATRPPNGDDAAD